jgi:hypothetical protein
LGSDSREGHLKCKGLLSKGGPEAVLGTNRRTHPLGFSHAATAAVDMNQQEMVATELKAASASLLFAMTAIECGDWAAAEQSMVDALQRSEVAMREIAAKNCEPPTPAEDLEDEPATGSSS